MTKTWWHSVCTMVFMVLMFCRQFSQAFRTN